MSLSSSYIVRWSPKREDGEGKRGVGRKEIRKRRGRGNPRGKKSTSLSLPIMISRPWVLRSAGIGIWVACLGSMVSTVVQKSGQSQGNFIM